MGFHGKGSESVRARAPSQAPRKCEEWGVRPGHRSVSASKDSEGSWSDSARVPRSPRVRTAVLRDEV